MNTPWPKLITSIRPNTRVRPEAMRNTIMPMASPATVRVTQDERSPNRGEASTTSAGTRASGTQSRGARGRSGAVAGSGAEEPVIGGCLPDRRSRLAARRSTLAAARHMRLSAENRSRSLMRVHAEPQEFLLQRLIGHQVPHRARMRDAAVIHDHDAVAEHGRRMEVLLDQQNR